MPLKLAALFQPQLCPKRAKSCSYNCNFAEFNFFLSLAGVGRRQATNTTIAQQSEWNWAWDGTGYWALLGTGEHCLGTTTPTSTSREES